MAGQVVQMGYMGALSRPGLGFSLRRCGLGKFCPLTLVAASSLRDGEWGSEVTVRRRVLDKQPREEEDMKWRGSRSGSTWQY